MTVSPLLLAFLCLAPVAAAQEPPVPAFGGGDLSDLTCRVTGSVPAGKGSVLVEVEVKNGGRLTAEPLVFSLSASRTGPAVDLQRMPMPHARRHGLGVPGGGSRRYVLQAQSEKDLRRAQVKVAKALFHDGEPLAESPVRVGTMRHAQVDDQGMRVDATTVGVTNLLDLPVDAVLLGTFTRPYSGPALLTLRLQPGESLEWQITMMPAMLKWWGAPGTYGVVLEKLEPIDWTVVRSVDESALAGEVVQAYRRWYQWPSPYPALTGSFHLRVARSDRHDGGEQEVRGTFRLKDFAPPFTEVEGSVELDLRTDLEEMMIGAFADLRRPSPEEFAQKNTYLQWDRDKVLLDGPGWKDIYGKVLHLSAGRLLGNEIAEMHGQTWREWQLREEREGYLVIGRVEHYTDKPNFAWSERRGYGRLGQLIVPASLQRTRRYGDFRESMHLILKDLRIADLSQLPPVQGAAAGELRDVWDAPYRYPEGPATLEARYEIENPGNDDLWSGERKVKGTMVLEGFRGFLQHRPGWSDFDIRVEGDGLLQQLRSHLAYVVEDRLRMWADRDFAGRALFDQAFAGATVEADPDQPGRYIVKNGQLAAVRVEGGRIVELELADGRRRRLSWRKVGGQDIATVVVTQGPERTEKLTASFRRAADGWLVPTQMRFEDVFMDWGPETLVLKDAKVR